MNRKEKRKLAEDRRIEDVGPPVGWRDRRKGVERRIPVTEEVDVTDSQWATYFGPRSDEAADDPQPTHDAEGAFDRVRR
ncbi:MAG: hypothetical protein J0M01_09595 [Dechloromonas sp.]|jgi:hypothetical protein|nr:hypothetical protein [Dechloromonas sp.]MBN8463053.1 hypothetical protein [Dechloromonas sp.]